MPAHYLDDQRRLVHRPAGRQALLIQSVVLIIFRSIVMILDEGVCLDDTQRQCAFEGGLREPDDPAAAHVFAEQEHERGDPLRVGGQAFGDQVDARRLGMITDQELMAVAAREDFQYEGASIHKTDALHAPTEDRPIQLVRNGTHRQRVKHHSSFPARATYRRVYTAC